MGNQDESGGLHSQDTTEHAAQRHTQAKALRVPQAKDVAEFHALCLVTMAKKQKGYLKRATKTARWKDEAFPFLSFSFLSLGTAFNRIGSQLY